MIDGGISDTAIAEYFGYTRSEIESWRAADFFTGAPRSPPD